MLSYSFRKIIQQIVWKDTEVNAWVDFVTNETRFRSELSVQYST